MLNQLMKNNLLMFVLKLQKLLQTKRNKEMPGKRTSFLYYIENKIGLDKTDKDLYNILACIQICTA